MEFTRFSNYEIYIVFCGFVLVLRDEILTTRFFDFIGKVTIYTHFWILKGLQSVFLHPK